MMFFDGTHDLVTEIDRASDADAMTEAVAGAIHLKATQKNYEQKHF